MKLLNQKSLIKFVKSNSPESFFHSDERGGLVKDDGKFYEQSIVIKNYDFNEIIFDGIKFNGIDFQHCTFTDCQILNVEGFFFNLWYCEFNRTFFRNCNFIHGYFKGLKFESCPIKRMSFEEGDLIDIEFENCNHIEDFINFSDVSDVRFVNSSLQTAFFSGPSYYRDSKSNTSDLSFKRCDIDISTFFESDLTSSNFDKCQLYRTSFNNCHISENTFELWDNEYKKSQCNIDINTILNSSTLSIEILNEYFGINYDLLSSLNKSAINKIEHQSVFISYSFKDRNFANKLNDFLKKKGIKTFLWEQNAITGKGVKKIMSDGIQEYDRVLFISSENSLKSKPCQFELTQARLKKEKEWSEVYFPIHLDKFLYDIQEHEIPLKNRNEYWSNILELREINSKDFSRFNKEKFNLLDFDRAVNELIEGLKK